MHDGIERVTRLMDSGELDEAEHVLLGLLEERPEDARANYLMSSLCDGRDQERQAVPFYQCALARPEELSEEDLWITSVEWTGFHYAATPSLSVTSS